MKHFGVSRAAAAIRVDELQLEVVEEGMWCSTPTPECCWGVQNAYAESAGSHTSWQIMYRLAYIGI
jgi:hypothetical protein